MKSRLIIAAAAIALSVGFAAPSLAQFDSAETPMGYTDDGRLNVFGARIDPPTTGADERRGILGRGGLPVNGPAAGYAITPY